MLRRVRPLRTLCWMGGDFPERKVTGVIDFWQTTGSAPPLAVVMHAQLGDEQRHRDAGFRPCHPLHSFFTSKRALKVNGECVLWGKVCLSPTSPSTPLHASAGCRLGRSMLSFAAFARAEPCEASLQNAALRWCSCCPGIHARRHLAVHEHWPPHWTTSAEVPRGPSLLADRHTDSTVPF